MTIILRIGAGSRLQVWGSMTRWLRREMADRWLVFDLAKVKKWFEDAGFENVKVELTRTKCCGISLHGRKAEIGIFVADGSKPKPMARL
jgi:hypothetical protein